MCKSKVTNDQGDIIQALKDKNFRYVWERVKFVGFKEVPNFDERYLICYNAANKFDPEKNNNFIMFYKNYLKFFRYDQNETFRVTSSRINIKRLKEQAISPTNGSGYKMIEELRKWNN